MTDMKYVIHEYIFDDRVEICFAGAKSELLRSFHNGSGIITALTN